MRTSRVFSGEADLFEAQLDQLFARREDTEIDLILRVVELILYQSSESIDLVNLYKELGPEGLSKLINVVGGRTVSIPQKSAFKETLLLALCYYYKEIKGMEWEQIKAVLPFDISGISYGIRIKNLNSFIRQRMDELLRSPVKEPRS